MKNMSDIWERVISRKEKIAIQTGEKHREEYLRMLSKVGIKSSIGLRIGEQYYGPESPQLTFNVECGGPKVGCISFCTAEWYRDLGYEVYPFEALFSNDMPDMSDFDSLL
jgi:hypothetical protein